jgi:hypothetical protein
VAFAFKIRKPPKSRGRGRILVHIRYFFREALVNNSACDSDETSGFIEFHTASSLSQKPRFG